jgi:hypothetical protein
MVPDHKFKFPRKAVFFIIFFKMTSILCRHQKIHLPIILLDPELDKIPSSSLKISLLVGLDKIPSIFVMNLQSSKIRVSRGI